MSATRSAADLLALVLLVGLGSAGTRAAAEASRAFRRRLIRESTVAAPRPSPAEEVAGRRSDGSVASEAARQVPDDVIETFWGGARSLLRVVGVFGDVLLGLALILRAVVVLAEFPFALLRMGVAWVMPGARSQRSIVCEQVRAGYLVRLRMHADAHWP